MTPLLLSLAAVGVVALALVACDARRKYSRLFRYFAVLTRRIRFAIAIVIVIYVVAVWYGVTSARVVRESYLPSPSAVATALYELVASGALLSNLAISVLRVFIAFGAASLVGVSLGALAGAFAGMAAAIIPLNSAIRYIPPTAFISLSILWFGIEEREKIVLIALGVVFYILQMTADAVRSVPRVQIEAAETLGATRWEVFWKVIIPFSLPDILAVLRINIGAAWTFLVVAELVSATHGLGYILASSQRFLQTPTLFATIIVLGVVGYLSDAIAAVAINFAGRWRRTL